MAEKDDRWVPTACYSCYNQCIVRAHRVDGVVVKIEGIEGNPHNDTRVCAKGNAGIMSLYDPYRVRTPLKRTNPEKGLGIDPRWVEIGWEEAIDTVVERLKKVKEDDPRKLVVQGVDFSQVFAGSVFAAAFGTPNYWKGASDYFCGNAVHPVTYLTTAGFYATLDLEYCNYCIQVGFQMGFMHGHNAVTETLRMAEARLRGMKLVVIDPVGTPAAAKADDWLPIRPGTDAALILAMINVLLNEIKTYDEDFLKKRTNAPYLIGGDGYYLRDRDHGKPLIWDAEDGQAKPFDAEDIKDFALEGSWVVDGKPGRPAFELLRDHVKKYTPEGVSSITTIPADTIRRIAREFGEAARIGSRIVIDGVELPYRPAAVIWNKGTSHRHGMAAGLAAATLNIVVGAVNVPGGCLGQNPKGPFWEPKEGPDGLIVPADIQMSVEPSYPARKVEPPDSVYLRQLFPVAPYSDPLLEEGVLYPEKYALPYKPEILINCVCNPMMSTANPKRMAEVLKRFSFIVSFTTHLTETAEFADIIFPDAHFLERFSPRNSVSSYMAAGPGSWYWRIAQPVVEPPPGVRLWVDVLLEIADRLGIRGEFNVILSSILRLKEPYRLNSGEKYTPEEMGERWLKSWVGPEYDLDLFKEKGYVVSSTKAIKDVYMMPFVKPRVPIYFEYLKGAGEEIKRVTGEMGIPWDVSDYQPLLDWKPCPGYEKGSSEYNLYAVNYKLAFHAFSYTTQNPWLNELAEHHPYAYKIMVNSHTAEKKRLRDGDMVYVESEVGKVKGVLKTTECIHPEVIGIAGTFGNWAVGRPIAKGKGVHFGTLISSTPENIDPVCAAVDACPRVRVYKA